MRESDLDKRLLPGLSLSIRSSRFSLIDCFISMFAAGWLAVQGRRLQTDET